MKRLFEKRLLGPEDLKPSRDDFEVVGVFNPGAVRSPSGAIFLLVRVAERPAEKRSGFVALPRYDIDSGQIAVDWEPEDDVRFLDARVVMDRAAETVRLTFISHLRTVVLSDDGRDVADVTPYGLRPGTGNEEFGVEDPRITWLAGSAQVAYVAVSRHGVSTALAETQDFQTFTRRGIIFCPENKDVSFFPEKIGDRFYALHRPNAGTPFCKPEMWLASSPDMLSWGGHRHLLTGQGLWDAGRIGGGAPPIKTDRGWLCVYHGNAPMEGHRGVGAYTAGALLLDLEDPGRILARAPEIMAPQADFEREGFMPDVVFPTGIVSDGDKLSVYYGAADTCTAVVEWSLQELLEQLA